MEQTREFKPLTLPQLEWNKKQMTNTYGELIAQPLEPGFGITLGNALRRVLLGGVEGSAVTSVTIKGVNNEFTALPGVVEDTMQLVLNIKQIIVRNKSGKSGTMQVHVDGEGVVRAGDIKTDEHLEIINKEHVIAHVAPDGMLDITFHVESGRGYQAAAWPEGKPLQEDDRIYLDAMFTPVTNVTFDVEKTRVGKDIDYDKLILRVTTDGTETPVSVLHYSVSVLRTQLERFLVGTEISFNELSKAQGEVVSDEVSYEETGAQRMRGISTDILLKPIEALELSARAHNCLAAADIKRIIDLVRLRADDVDKIKNFGRKSLTEVQDALKMYGLTLGMDISDEDLDSMRKKMEASFH